MLLSRRERRLSFTLLPCLWTAPVSAQESAAESVLAGTPEPGHGSLSVRLGYYDRSDDGDGNPFLDEDLTVIEPIVIYDYQVSENFGWYGKFSYDNVSSASIDRLSDFPNQSGASGDEYFGYDLGLRYRVAPEWQLGWHASYSTEYDYDSIGLGASAQYEPVDKDATVKFSVETFYDEIDIIRFDGSEDGDDDRISVAGTVNWYQIIDPKTHGDLGATVGYQSGFLETSFNAVVIEDPALPPNPNLENNARGIEVTEELPDSRLRTAVFGRVRRLLRPGSALELGGRLYVDDWGIGGYSAEPRFYQTLSEHFRLRLRYRYYQQAESKYYDDHFSEADNHRTQDSDLADFVSHTFGTKLIWIKSDAHTWDAAVDYIDRDDGLDSLLLSAGWTWSF